MKFAKKTIVMAALLVAVVAPAEAQQRGARKQHGPRGINVEAALRMREELKLSSAQVAQLESLRKEIVAQRQREAVEMIDLRSRVEAGNVPQGEMRKQMEGRRDEMQKIAQARREQFEKILTEDQRAQLGRAHMNVRQKREPRRIRR